ncbi:MAG: DNA translocase FtsK 4TM domain-containing protein [Magnetospirillum sp.]|nr:DNA translocase FtsK 4TM domain-containing protein [Magnetospirillum sp.]
MAAIGKGKGRHTFLPAGLVEGLRRLAVRLGGVLLTAAAAAAATALVTASGADPSLDTAVDAPVNNALGLPGAIVADLLLQWFGFAAIFAALTPAAWGLRIAVKAEAPTLWSWRLSALPVALVALAVALAPLPVRHGLPRHAGGAIGELILRAVPREFVWMAAAGAGLAAVLIGAFALAVSRKEWAGFGRRSAEAATAGGSRAAAVGRWMGAMTLSRDGGAKMRVTPMEPRAATPTWDGDGDGDGEEDAIAPVRAGMPRPDADNPGTEENPANRGPVVEPKRPPAPPGKRERAARQGNLDLGDHPEMAGYELPPLTLLAMPPDQGVPRLNQDALAQNARMLESVLVDFGVNGQVVKVRPGPVVTLYELEPAPGTKTSRVIGLADDIARSMSALSVRIATIPGRSVIGIELPNVRREIVYLRELLAADQFEKAQARLNLVLGKDIGGAPVMVDLARMPHLLIAGTTGSGKSVAVNTMILSLLYRLRPQECRLIMIDPKMLELSVYDGIPHLLAPVVTEPGKAVVALKWAVREMEDRYRAMSQLGVRNIAGYNQRLAEAAARGETLTRTVQTGFDPETGKPVYEDQVLALEPLPFIVVIVDEMADLMLVAGKDIEAAVQRLAQMARAAGIHLIMATQRPSVDVITGTIKANFPTRISFQVTSKIDSRTILGEQGAEQLLGQGDMLYMAAGGRITRVHGPFVSDQEVEKVVEHLRAQGEPNYEESVTEEAEDDFGAQAAGGGSGDDLYDQAVALVAREGKASTSFIQRHLQIGYNRAARLIERMEAEGVVGKPNHVGKREVLVRGGGGRDEY